MVTFTGTERGVGCTFTVARLGTKLASHTTASVCLVDANLRWPALHNTIHTEACRACGRKNEHGGLLEALTDDSPIQRFVRPTAIENLWLLPAGGSAADACPLLTSERTKCRFDELARNFDFVLVDTPAMTCMTDAGVIARMTEGIILVIAAGQTHQDNAAEINRSVELEKMPVIGAVLNKCAHRIPDFLYRSLYRAA